MRTESRGTMHGWIWRANLLPFVETIAGLVRCRLDDHALTVGIEDSDAADDNWFTFVLNGQPRVEMHFARTRTDDTVLVDVELDGIDEALEIRTALLLNVCNRYRLTPETGRSSPTSTRSNEILLREEPQGDTLDASSR